MMVYGSSLNYLEMQEATYGTFDADLNRKISVWRGELRNLKVGGIVFPMRRHLRGGYEVKFADGEYGSSKSEELVW